MRAEAYPGRRALRGDAAGADERTVAHGERLDLDRPAGLRRMDHPAVADVQADVAEPVKEEEVARAEARAADGATDAIQGRGIVRQRDTDAAGDPHDEPRG